MRPYIHRLYGLQHQIPSDALFVEGPYRDEHHANPFGGQEENLYTFMVVRTRHDHPLTAADLSEGVVLMADVVEVAPGLRLHTKGGIYLPDRFTYRAITTIGLSPPYERVAYTSFDLTRPGSRRSLRGYSEFEEKFLNLGELPIEWSVERIQQARNHLNRVGVQKIVINQGLNPQFLPLVEALQ
jgi:hypothetical protein